MEDCKTCGCRWVCESVWKDVEVKGDPPVCHKASKRLRERTQEQLALEITWILEERERKVDAETKKGNLYAAIFIFTITIINIAAMIIQIMQ